VRHADEVEHVVVGGLEAQPLQTRHHVGRREGTHLAEVHQLEGIEGQQLLRLHQLLDPKRKDAQVQDGVLRGEAEHRRDGRLGPALLVAALAADDLLERRAKSTFACTAFST
jgi:hypothetical protein